MKDQSERMIQSLNDRCFERSLDFFVNGFQHILNEVYLSLIKSIDDPIDVMDMLKLIRDPILLKNIKKHHILKVIIKLSCIDQLRVFKYCKIAL